MIVLSILLLCNNYKSYCLNEIKADTSIIMKYRNTEGIFFDKEAVIRITKKTALADSLALVNKFNELITKRQEEQLLNCKEVETKFDEYTLSVKKEKEELNRKFNLKIAGKNVLIGMFTTATTILGVLYFLK